MFYIAGTAPLSRQLVLHVSNGDHRTGSNSHLLGVVRHLAYSNRLSSLVFLTDEAIATPVFLTSPMSDEIQLNLRSHSQKVMFIVILFFHKLPILFALQL